MLALVYRSIVCNLLLAFLFCGIYPFLVTVLGQAVFPLQAQGGIVVDASGKPVGAKLIGQFFSRPEYFQARPSATASTLPAPNGYDASNSAGSNLGPTNQKFVNGLRANIQAVLGANPKLKAGEIPTDLVTASASGLDPHISSPAAWIQLARVSKSRSVAPDLLRGLVEQFTEKPLLGFLGEPVVNVLLLNLELDRRFPKKLDAVDPS